MCVNTIVNFQFKQSSLYQKVIALSKESQTTCAVNFGWPLNRVIKENETLVGTTKRWLDGLTKVASCKRFLFIYS